MNCKLVAMLRDYGKKNVVICCLVVSFNYNRESFFITDFKLLDYLAAIAETPRENTILLELITYIVDTHFMRNH